MFIMIALGVWVRRKFQDESSIPFFSQPLSHGWKEPPTGSLVYSHRHWQLEGIPGLFGTLMREELNKTGLYSSHPSLDSTNRIMHVNWFGLETNSITSLIIILF